MVRAAILVGLTCWLGMIAGCRCMPAMEKYHDTIDCVSDIDIYWDRWYHPPWDVSRAGRPDWCSSSFNRKVCPCRCQQGIWYGYANCQHYPPNHPYVYPSQAVPLQGILSPSKPVPPPEVMKTPEIPADPLDAPPKPEPTLEAPPKPNSPEAGSAERLFERAWLPTSFRSESKLDAVWLETE